MQSFGQKVQIKVILPHQDIKLALRFIQHKFPNTRVKSSVSQLCKYYQQRYLRPLGDSMLYVSRNNLERQSDKIVFDVSGQTKHRVQVDQDKQLQQKRTLKIEDTRLIARLFCEQGADLSVVKKFIPDITPQIYRSKLNSIVNNVIKDLLVMLKGNCQIQVRKLTESQKIIIRAALRDAHNWMSLNNLKAFQTFLKMITKRYIRKLVVTNEEIKQLYSAIARRVNDKCLDIEDIKPKSYLGEEIREQKEQVQRKKREMSTTITAGDQQRICSAYISCLDIQKAISILIQKYSFSCKWQKNTVQHVIINRMQQSLQKIVQLQNKSNHSNERLPVSSQTARSIFESQQNSLKLSLMNVVLIKKMKKIEYQLLVDLLKGFLTTEIQRQHENIIQRETKNDQDDLYSQNADSVIESMDSSRSNESRRLAAKSKTQILNNEIGQCSVYRNNEDND